MVTKYNCVQTVRKNCSSDWKTFCKFDAKGLIIWNFLRSLEKCIKSVKGNSNFRSRIFNQLFSGGFLDLIGTIKMAIWTSYLDIDTYMNKLENFSGQNKLNKKTYCELVLIFHFKFEFLRTFSVKWRLWISSLCNLTWNYYALFEIWCSLTK